MLEKLLDRNGLIDIVSQDIEDCLKFNHSNGWGTLKINRRKPHTYRLFKHFGDVRICLHKFDPCTDEEAFPHPHPWPGAFLLLEGSYIQTIGYSVDEFAEPEFIYREKVMPGSSYEIVNPLTWHKIQPLKTTYTIMMNAEPFSYPHRDVRTTAGKDLDTFSKDEIYEVMSHFSYLLHYYLNGDI